MDYIFIHSSLDGLDHTYGIPPSRHLDESLTGNLGLTQITQFVGLSTHTPDRGRDSQKGGYSSVSANPVGTQEESGLLAPLGKTQHLHHDEV